MFSYYLMIFIFFENYCTIPCPLIAQNKPQIQLNWIENLPTFWRYFDVMKRVLQNQTRLKSIIFLIVSRSSNFKTNFTFILYLESVSVYVNWKLNNMLRKWRHWNITFDSITIWRG